MTAPLRPFPYPAGPPDHRAVEQIRTALNQLRDRLEYVATLGGGGGGGAGLTMTAADVDLGAQPRSAGTFTLSGTGLTPGRPVLVVQAPGPYVGKGTLPDEAEMDGFTVAAIVETASLIRCWWSAGRNILRGNVRVFFAVSG